MSRKCILAAGLIILFIQTHAHGPQIPNGNFSQWVNYFTPVNWATVDDIFGTPLGFTYRDTTDVTGGDSASVKVISGTIAFAPPGFGVVTGIVALGSATYNPASVENNGPTFYGLPFTFRPDTLFFSYQYSTPGSDSGLLQITLTKDDNTILGGQYGYTYRIYPTGGQWVHEALLLTPLYTSSVLPDTLLLQFLSSSGITGGEEGSTLILDAVRLGYVNTSSASATILGSNSFCQGGSVMLKANTNPAYNYQWWLNGAAIPGANDSTYLATDSGNYYVIIDSDGAPGISDTVLVIVYPGPAVSLTIGSQARDTSLCLGSNTVALYPNPTGGVFTGISGATFSPDSIGIFPISYSYTSMGHGCLSTVFDTISVSACSGINNAETGMALHIYPNPANEMLYLVTGEDLQGYRLQLYDIVGRPVLNSALDGSTHVVDISSLPSGAYVCTISDKRGDVVFKNKLTVIR